MSTLLKAAPAALAIALTLVSRRDLAAFAAAFAAADEQAAAAACRAELAARR